MDKERRPERGPSLSKDWGQIQRTIDGLPIDDASDETIVEVRQQRRSSLRNVFDRGQRTSDNLLIDPVELG
jgi:hypothetical protein